MSTQADHKDVAVSYYERFIKVSKPAKGHPIHMQLANLKAVIQMEKSQKNQPKTADDGAEDTKADDAEAGDTPAADEAKADETPAADEAKSDEATTDANK